MQTQVKIKNKDIIITLNNGYYIGPSTITYIEQGLEYGFNYGVLRGKAKKNKIGEWKIIEKQKGWFRKLMGKCFDNNY